MENYWSVNNDGVLTINADTYILNDILKEKADGVLPTAITQPWLAEYEKEDITKIKFIGEGLSFPKNSYGWFDSYINVTEIKGLELVSTKNVTNMNSMFSYCENLTELDLSNFDTSKVVSMERMFACMLNLKKLNLTSFDTSNVSSMNSMFKFCEKLTELDLSSFDTSNVSSMNSMFANMRSLKELDLSSFDTSNVTDITIIFDFNLAYKNNKVKFKNDIDFTKKAKTEETEEKTKPNYYKLKTIEVFDFIDEFELNFNIGNVAKYIARYQNKNGLEDLEKAKVYLSREINKLKKGV